MRTQPPTSDALTPVPTRGTQQLLAAVFPAAFAALDARLDALVQPLTPAERTTPRPGGGWSVDQVLEHLCIANQAYLKRLARADGPERTATATTEWRASIIGGLLINSMQRPRRLPAPARAQPAPTARPDVLATLHATHRELIDLLAERASRDWRALRFRSPLANIVRLNFGDGPAILLAHGRRHTAQIERTITAVRASSPSP